MTQKLYKGYCIEHQQNGNHKISGFSNVFYSIDTAKQFIDILAMGITRVNENCKPTICPKCQGK